MCFAILSVYLDRILTFVIYNGKNEILAWSVSPPNKKNGAFGGLI